MHDADEGLDVDGFIVTGVRRDRVPAAFEPVIAAAIGETGDEPSVSIYLYGSVATGLATSSSDVDFLTIGLDSDKAEAIGRRLSAQFAGTCRGAELAPAFPADFDGEADSQYGNRVFLYHYCLPLRVGSSTAVGGPFPGDTRAARGFNGDIDRHLAAWRRDVDLIGSDVLGRRVARKTLLALAGLVSIRDRTWTTDRDYSARRWKDLGGDALGVEQLLAWSNGAEVASKRDLAEALSERGVVSKITSEFGQRIGFHSVS